MNEELDFQAKNGVTYTIEIDDSGEKISVFLDREPKGEICMSCIEDEHSSHYYITSLALDDCAGIGIGRECLLRHKEMFDSPITAAEDDGIRKDDGSHLTGNGPGFIRKMREEGIVCPAYNSSEDDY